MDITKLKKFGKHTLLSLLAWIGTIALSNAQNTTIYGPGTSFVNEVTYYSVSINDNLMHPFWTILGGNSSNNQPQSVSVTWTMASSNNSVTYEAEGAYNYYYGFKTVSVSASSPPATPPAPTVTNNCGETILTRATPPSGETYYWQSSSSGTSTSNSVVSVTRTSGTVYYLRSKKNSLWSSARTVNYTVSQPTTYYADFDGDGKGDPDDTLSACSQPPSYVTNSSDLCPSDHGGTNSNGCSTPTALSDENYIYTVSPQVAVKGISQITQDKDAIKQVTYFDGLGRPMQDIAIKQSASGRDIITHMEYNALGQMEKEYLPYVPTTAGSEGLYRASATALSGTSSFYNTATYENTTNPYSEKQIEGSPMERPLKQAAPGYDWRMGGGHEIGMEYDSNAGNEVYRFTVTTGFANDTYTPILSLDTSSGNNYGFYWAEELYKGIVRDENHDGTSSKLHTVEEFKDRQGRVVLKRTYGDSDVNMDGDTNDPGEDDAQHDTYYVYDDFGNLAYVIPPKVKVSDGVSPTELSDLCYQYKYDHRNRLVEKKIPGKDWEYMIYDDLDRVVMTQDRLLRDANKWLYTKYDVLGRVAYTGMHTNTSQTSRTAMQSYFNSQTVSKPKYYESKVTSGTGIDNSYYTNNNFPNSNIEILTVNYYDDYNFNRAGSNLPQSISHEYSVSLETSVKGLATGTRVKVLDQSPSKWVTSVIYYDAKERPVYTYAYNEYLQTTDIVHSDLNFTGRLDETLTTHARVNNGLGTLSIRDVYSYDHANRLEKQTQELNGSGIVEVLFDNTYDELGQLQSKGVGGKSTQGRLQTVDYKYNIRGWLKMINDPANLGTDLFSFKINYNTTEMGISGFSTPLYNGNISETIWRTANTETYGNRKRGYGYRYDAFNRILAGEFRRANSAGSSYSEQNDTYDLYGVVYDKNGNITTLKRKGHTNIDSNGNVTSFGTMDNLFYTYYSDSNKLQNLQELTGGNSTYGFKDGYSSSTEYTYDQNGNMVKDMNKGIEGGSGTNGIIYNHLNLPTEVRFGIANKIRYIYDATGIKLEKKVVESGKPDIYTYYSDNYVYEGSSLKFINQPEGYIDTENGNKYVYQFKDQVGNIRLSYGDFNNNGNINPATEILEENNYYPFGLLHNGYNRAINSTNIALKNKFGGKEIQSELGLNWYDVTSRNFDPAIGRWMNVDPLSEKMRRYSPYNYGFDNPIYFIDPDGQIPTGGSDKVKKVVSSNSEGNISSTRSVSHKGKYLCSTCKHTLPASGKSDVGSKLEFSIIKDDFSGPESILIPKLPSFESTLYASVESTVVSNQYYDSDGNAVASIEEASTFEVSKTVSNSTVKIGTDLPQEGVVSTFSTKTTYDVAKYSNSSEFGGKQLVNGNTTTIEDSVKTVDFNNLSSSLQDLAKNETISNIEKKFKASEKIILDGLKNLDKESFSKELLKKL